MNTGKVRTLITTALYFIMVMVISVSCDTNQGMMHGNGTTTMNSWNWGQLLIGVAVSYTHLTLPTNREV